ncbi:MAG TPA: response regulator [Clostridiales bacterium]|nr:response regulator [Clostridiales bacterium]
MYKVLVVDDEVSSLNHLCNIIKQKSQGFVIIDTATNGAQALEKIESAKPDVLFTDVLMPIINGIELAAKVKETDLDILTVIVSGHSDFEYARGAIQSEVCEYILKPVRPSEIEKLMVRLRDKLDVKYYEKRKLFLKRIAGGNPGGDEKRLKNLFPDENYYAAIYRKNGLPARFSEKGFIDIYSLPDEKVIMYGRDENEILSICPADLIYQKSWWEYFQTLYKRMLDEASFLTAIVRKDAFESCELPRIIRTLYNNLDESIVIGQNQLLLQNNIKPLAGFKDDGFNITMLEHYIKINDSAQLKKSILQKLKKWEEDKYPQILVEEKIRFLLMYFSNRGYIESINEILLDDIFSETISMGNLSNSICSLLFADQKADLIAYDKEHDYRMIIQYLEGHLNETISAQSICKRFAMSQNTLSRIFNKYAGCSFSKLLTQMRMERAKKYMMENPRQLIRDIADSIGISDQFYFSRVFRSYYGVSPTEYMEGLMVKIPE